jgi:2-polyprenyl-6-methoxyphenol hydroxylase-like FAD-dependent oxidoreductase
MTGVADVLVVGAGPVGLMLAGELRLGGASVVVAEQRTAPMTESRASTLHSRTMEIFDCRGLLDALGTPPSDPRGHFGGIPLDLTLPGPYPGQWKVPQVRTEALLQQWATSLGAEMRRGVRVDGLTAHEDCVEATVTGPDGQDRLRARYVVGCDGEVSTVRRLAGFAFPLISARNEMLRADVGGIEIPNRRFQRLPAGLAIASRGPDGVTRVMVHAHGAQPRPDGAEPAFSDVVAAWKQVTGEDIGHGAPYWVNAFTDVSGQAGSYRSGRVLLAGDAAHVQMPVGGQALNLGLQDAVNLGWKLALVVRGRAGQQLLDSYNAERRAAGAQVLGNIRAQALLLLGGAEVDAARQVIAELMRLDSVRTRLARAISGTGIQYDVGAGSLPLLGTPVAHVSVRTESGVTTTAAQLRTGRGILLLPSAVPELDAAGLAAAARGWADRVDLLAGDVADDDSALAASGAALIRPDGYLAWAGSTPAALSVALRRWFGPPASLPDSRTAAGDVPSWAYGKAEVRG